MPADGKMGWCELEYSGLNAKIKALRGTLIKRQDYVDFSRFKSGDELLGKLNEIKDYKKAMEGVPTDSSRYKIEQNIYMSFMDELNRIYDFVGDHKIRKFLDAFYLNNEIRVIKILLCMIYDEREIDFSKPELMVLIGKSLKIDVNKVKSAKTVADFIECLNGTDIYKLLSRVYKVNTSLFELEMQLDLYYYSKICKIKDKNLSGINKKILDKIIGTEIDLKNIIWIYRLKRFYNPAENIIYTYLVPYSHRLKRSHLARMVNAKTNEDLLAEIRNGPYSKVFGKSEDLERSADAEMMRLYTTFEAMYPNSIAVTIAYLFYKELEIGNVISLIEGVRYELDPKEILSYLVLKPEAGYPRNRGDST